MKSRLGESRLSEDEQALLQDEALYSKFASTRHPRRRLVICAASIQILLITLYSAVFWVASRRICRCENPVIWSPLGSSSASWPAHQAIQFEPRPFLTNLEEDNHFAGRPRPELDQAWHDLLKNDNMQIAAKELEKLNLTSIPVKDTGDVIVSLGSYHALHCLKKTRQMIYSSHYHEGKDEKSMARELMHANHCIEYIREYLMCHPDLSWITFHWINQTSKFEPDVLMPTTWDKSIHECASWTALDKWAAERSFDLYNVDRLVRPEHGLT